MPLLDLNMYDLINVFKNEKLMVAQLKLH